MDIVLKEDHVDHFVADSVTESAIDPKQVPLNNKVNCSLPFLFLCNFSTCGC